MESCKFDTYEIEFLGKKLFFLDFGVESVIPAYNLCEILCDKKEDIDNLFLSLSGEDDKNNLCLEINTAIKFIQNSKYENKDSLIEAINNTSKWLRENFKSSHYEKIFITEALLKEKEKLSSVRNVLSFP